MNKFKSLSDSSTSESEEDYGKRKNNASYESWSGLKRTRSTDEEESHAEMFLRMANSGANFKSPNKYSERRFSTDDTEDETSEPISKKPKGDFKNPAKYIERELSTDQTGSGSDSDSEEKSTATKMVANMPSMDILNGSYGVGMKMMEKMGYKTGKGLGKNEQGRVNIVEASNQRGRRGLGMKIAGLEPSDTIWDASQEEILVKEEVSWMPDCNIRPPKLFQLEEWMIEGKKKELISDETEFCDPEILKKVITYKSVFDKLEPEEMRKARSRSNPFETIRGGIFLNRAAMKMANMDSRFDFMFTDPKDMNGRSAVGENELLYFADVCAGPGGFSEYVLWKKKWGCKGFGFTLKGKNDFKLEDFFAGPPETFEPYYGVDEDGDIYSPRNLRSLQEFVHSNSGNKGVHFMMADGGFSVEGRENEQEILSKRLYLCQFLCALLILRKGGHFVCKLFDLFTPFSVGLVYLMWMAFEKVCIFKPITSRPANSERYIICKWLKDDTKDIAEYMFKINERLGKLGSTSTVDVAEVVPLNILKGDEEFYNYIVESNDKLGTNQIIHLDKIRVFAQNVNLHETRQSDIRKECLALWGVPDKARAAPPKSDPDATYKVLMQGEKLNYIKSSVQSLTQSLLKKLDRVFDFHCVVCGETKTPPNLFISLGKSNIYQYDPNASKWLKLDVTLELPANTLFYGELIQELKGESRAQRRISALHLIDAIYLGGTDVRNFHFEKRMHLAEKLAKAVSKPSRSDYIPFRVKEIWNLPRIEEIFDRLAMRIVKNCHVPRLCFDLGDGRHIIATGLLIFQTTADPWMTAFSKTTQKLYLFNTKKNISSFEKVDEANASFKSCFSGRILWSWERGVQLIEEQNMECDKSLVQGQTIANFVRHHVNKMTGR
ncbi:cap-specific mRNA [Nephila pilipes]|uniref:Cap-specific mRNA (nucleoside-2'-O-)-methyltransferase 1 n=1 Tax=Nephila pilipes TaxID=299642 RepID=A0A8X6N3A8_NEPPI|nr:cap-specific mRNA [Nephila pilipes]